MTAFVAASTAEAALGLDIILNKPAGTIDDDLMIAVIVGENTLAITAPLGWTLVDSHTTLSGTDIYIYEKRADSEPSSYTFDVTSSSSAITGYISTHETAEIDVRSAITDSETASSITASESGRLLYIAGDYAPAGWAPPAGFTERVDFGTNYSTYLANKFIVSGATGDHEGTAPNGGGVWSMLIALKTYVPLLEGSDSLFFANNF